MKRREFLGSMLAVTAAAQGTAKPNVLLILADDLAAWMLGCYGNTEIRTPNIDRLARTGIRFSNSFVATPICSPSRATLFSGKLPRQHGIYDFLTASPVAKPPQGQKAAPEAFARETLLSDLLAGQGYRCGYVGKWHMGNDDKPGHGMEFTYTMTGGSRSYTDPEMYLNGEKRQEKGYLTELMTGQAVQFIGKQTADKPFFLSIGYLNPHTPYEGHPQRYYDLYKDSNFEKVGFEPAAANALREKGMLADMKGNMRKAAASLTALDDQIPVLLQALSAKGLLENTLIVVAGDNGYLHGKRGLWSKGLASDPPNMYDEVIKVPLIYSWLGKTPPNNVRPEFVSFYDFVPTICELTGAKAPAGLVGRSYATLVLGRAWPKKTPPWKNLVYAHLRNTEMVRDQYYKIVVRNDGEGPNELYDMRNDPGERRNRWEDPAMITIRESLQAELQRFAQRR